MPRLDRVLTRFGPVGITHLFRGLFRKFGPPKKTDPEGINKYLNLNVKKDGTIHCLCHNISAVKIRTRSLENRILDTVVKQ